MKRKHAGFSLTELLLVGAIIAVLVALMLPSLFHAKSKARALRDHRNVGPLYRPTPTPTATPRPSSNSV